MRMGGMAGASEVLSRRNETHRAASGTWALVCTSTQSEADRARTKSSGAGGCHKD